MELFNGILQPSVAGYALHYACVHSSVNHIKCVKPETTCADITQVGNRKLMSFCTLWDMIGSLIHLLLAALCSQKTHSVQEMRSACV